LDQPQGGVPQNDRAFASLSMTTQSAEYTHLRKNIAVEKALAPSAVQVRKRFARR
jgi:hypothetical protein